MIKISIMGPPGSGKTTQADILAEKYHFDQLNLGDFLRERAKAEDDEGRVIKAALDRGRLVDNRIVGRLMRQKLADPTYQKGFVVDGYPRNIDQLKFFDPDYILVFYLDIPDSESLERLLKRGREDDRPELIGKRLALYHELTEPVLSFYEKLGKLVRINGRGTIEEVAREIEGNLKVSSFR